MTARVKLDANAYGWAWPRRANDWHAFPLTPLCRLRQCECVVGSDGRTLHVADSARTACGRTYKRTARSLLLPYVLTISGQGPARGCDECELRLGVKAGDRPSAASMFPTSRPIIDHWGGAGGSDDENAPRPGWA